MITTDLLLWWITTDDLLLLLMLPRAEMIARESQLKNFFQNVEVATRGVMQTTSVARWTVSRTSEVYLLGE